MTTNSQCYGLILDKEDEYKRCLFTDDMKKICEYISLYFNDELNLGEWDKYIIITTQDFYGYVNWNGSDNVIAEFSDTALANQTDSEFIRDSLVELLC